MKLIFKLPLLALLAMLAFSCSTDNIDYKANEIALDLVKHPAKTIEIEILELINNHRLSIGLNPLEDLSIVKSIAYTHTDYMVNKKEISHDNFFVRSNYLKENASATKVSENVAYGYSSAESVVNGWLNSPGHKANLEGDFTNFDVAAEENAEGKWYYTNIFIKK